MTMVASIATSALFFISCGNPQTAQTEETKEFTADQFAPVYDDSADPVAQIKAAVSEADASGRYVVCQVGGNWCKWCLLFADWMSRNEEISKLVSENFVYTHINIYQRDEEGSRIYNNEAMQLLGKPSRFGFPVFVVLDGEGNVLHIQDSSFLEDGVGYSEDKVLRFFGNWTPKAVRSALR